MDRLAPEQVCVVTGANRGLGKATATALARHGGRVLLLCRSASNGEHAADDILRATGNDRLEVVQVDLASFASIRAAASSILARHQRLHLLVNNAGVNLPDRRLSADGLEMTLAVNHLAPFLLTRLLLPALHRGGARGRAARVVTVASLFERFGRIRIDDLQGARRYSGLAAYAQSKLANVLFTRALATRLDGAVTATCADPGLAATDLLRDHLYYRIGVLRGLWQRFLLTPESGARAAVIAGTSPALEGVSGECISRRGRVIRTSRRSRDRALAERLWTMSEELTAER